MQLLSGEDRRGFTLTELLTSVTLIGVLAGMLLPTLNRALPITKDRECLSQQRNNYIALQALHDEIAPDFTLKKDKSYDTLAEFFERSLMYPLIQDKDFRELGVYISRPLTCPYAASRGTSRAPFIVAPIGSFPPEQQSPKPKGVQYVTYTYGLEIEHLDLSRDSNKEIAVSDMPNFGLKEKTTVRNWFSMISRNGEHYGEAENSNQTISVDSSRFHPHKGKGAYVTFGDGSQRWMSEKEFYEAPSVKIPLSGSNAR